MKNLQDIIEDVKTDVANLLEQEYSGVFDEIKNQVEGELEVLSKDLKERGSSFLVGNMNADEFSLTIRTRKDLLFVKLIGIIGVEQIRAEKLKDEFVNLVIGTFNKD